MASKFEERLGDLSNSAAKSAEGLRTEKVKPSWFTGIGPEPTDIVDPFNYEGTKEAYSREREAKDYEQAISKSESFKKAQAAKIQSDTLAALERDTRMRHRTRVRMFAHATAKLVTHGLEDGPIRRGVLFVNRLKEQANG